MERVVSKKKKHKVVSLFAGIGGLDLGFEYAGFNVIWANDFDKYAVETYKTNVGNQIICGDIVKELDNIPPHDILMGGFPCQPFSTLGSLKGFDDERGTLFFVIKEIIKTHYPKVVVLENVKNLKNHDGGKTFERICHELDSLGYEVNHEVLNTFDFGIPQRRNRIYIVAMKRGSFSNYKLEYPKGRGCNIEAKNLLDKDVELKYFISNKMIGTILGEGTKGYIVKPTINTPIAKTLTATMHKCHRASQDNYHIDEYNWNKYKNEKYSKIRRITPNEARKLQGFPSDWKQVVSDTQMYKQFGNAVTVDVAYEVAKSIYNHIEKYRIDW